MASSTNFRKLLFQDHITVPNLPALDDQIQELTHTVATDLEANVMVAPHAFLNFSIFCPIIPIRPPAIKSLIVLAATCTAPPFVTLPLVSLVSSSYLNLIISNSSH